MVKKFSYKFVDAIIKQYLVGLGEFNYENYGNQYTDDVFIWIFFFLATFITQITFLNMLIAMMSLTFDNTINNTHEGLKE